MWSELPSDVTRKIFALRFDAMRIEALARLMQRAWRGYRVRVLCGRFRMLQYLQPFREYNPDLSTFLQRAKL